MSNEFKLIDLTTVKAKLQEMIDRTETQFEVVRQVVEALTAFEGKVISAHVANNLGKQYPSLKFRIDSPYSWYSLHITGDGFDAIDLQLCYKSEPKVISIKRITALNQRYLLDEERLPKYRAELATIEAKAKAYNDALLSVVAAEAAFYEVKFAITENNLIRVRAVAGRIVQ